MPNRNCYQVYNKRNPSFLVLFQAKALAEKNMRDLLAQREQAERNVIILNLEENLRISNSVLLINRFLILYWLQRLAETLDADVRRWSSGKEGNLRALLSTLQYVCVIFVPKSWDKRGAIVYIACGTIEEPITVTCDEKNVV